MIKDRQHTAMLEHGTVYLHINWPYRSPSPLIKYSINPYSITKYVDNTYDIYVTTNYRVLYENNWLNDLQYLCEPTEYHEKRITVKFICDRGVSHEFVRHRVFSFAQESTRQETMAA
jgi:thymidylate synthase (FAD)